MPLIVLVCWKASLRRAKSKYGELSRSFILGISGFERTGDEMRGHGRDTIRSAIAIALTKRNWETGWRD